MTDREAPVIHLHMMTYREAPVIHLHMMTCLQGGSGHTLTHDDLQGGSSHTLTHDDLQGGSSHTLTHDDLFTGRLRSIRKWGKTRRRNHPNDPNSPYTFGTSLKPSLLHNQPPCTFGLLRTTLQQNDCTGSSFPVTL